jgi:hypothetical protein
MAIVTDMKAWIANAERAGDDNYGAAAELMREAIEVLENGSTATIPINMPEGVPMISGEQPLGFDSADEIEPAFNMRAWVQSACEAKGAKMVGGGIGFGQADIDIELEGHRYNISIRALKKAAD